MYKNIHRDSPKWMDQASSNMKQEGNGASRLTFTKACDITETEIKWLWDGVIPDGKLSLLAGASGVGKTSLLCNFTATVSRGGIFPGSRVPCRRGRVIFLTGEDGISDTIISRLRLSGADMSNVEILAENVGKRDEHFNVHEHLLELEADIKNMGDVALIIIDPITTFMGINADTNQVGVVRPVCTKLKVLAERTGAGIIILNHLGKNSKASMQDRILGSSAWVAAPRSVMIAMEHEEHGRVLGVINSNIASGLGVYPYVLTNKDGEDDRKFYAEFKDHPLTLATMQEMIDDESLPGYGNKSDVACNIIAKVLADGNQHPKQDVIDACVREKIGVPTVMKCASQMGVKFETTNTFPPRAIWSIELAPTPN